jgi:hypothetical protein
VQDNDTVAGSKDGKRAGADLKDPQRPPTEEHRSKVARVEGWEPFERIDRADLDDH